VRGVGEKEAQGLQGGEDEAIDALIKWRGTEHSEVCEVKRAKIAAALMLSL
jgi:hypothetical protein